MKAKEMEGYNGPGKEKYWEYLGLYEETRLGIMKLTAKSGNILDDYERTGGKKNDLRDGFILKQLTPKEQMAELQRQIRIAGYHGIVDEDRTGQASFLRAFDVQEEMSGIGGAPLGSKSSIVRARARGFQDGRTKNGPSLQQGLEQFPSWEPDSDEALSYAEEFGEGLKLRPSPKPKKGDADNEGGEIGPQSTALEVMTETLKEMDQQAAAEKRPRGRQKKQAALPAPEAEAEQPSPTDGRWGDDQNVPRMVN
jgi:hypothetical protein